MTPQEAADAAAELSLLLKEATVTQKPAPAVIEKVRAFFAKHGVSSEVTVVNSSGGTQQIRNRIGQKGVQQATALSILYLQPEDSVEGVVHWLEGAFNGAHGNIRPRGPIAIAREVKSGDGFKIVAVVHAKPTSTSRLAGELFGAEDIDTRTRVHPVLPKHDDFFYLRSSTSQDEYADIEGARYTFKASIPNGLKLGVGAIVVTGNTTKSKHAAGCITGIGRVGRRLTHGDQVSAYYDRFMLLRDPLPLSEISSPTTNVNSITRVKREWLISVMRELGVSDVDALPVPIHELTLAAVCERLDQEGLVLPPQVVHAAVTALRSGKHLILTGPPGTGKTSLALALGEVAASRRLSGEPLLTTGTADWSSVETVGAYRLNRSNELEFRPGHVTQAIEEDRWLIIDELNRADIDKAIGQLFTVLSGHPVTLPFTSGSLSDGEMTDESDLPVERFISIVPSNADTPEGTNPVHVKPAWRLIATLNDRDQDLLFSLSEALMRRFAVVEMPPPSQAEWLEIVQRRGGSGRTSWDDAIGRAVEALNIAGRPLGAAVLLDCLSHLREVCNVALEEALEVDELAELQMAWATYVKPQLQLDSGLDVEIDLASLFDAPPDPSNLPATTQGG